MPEFAGASKSAVSAASAQFGGVSGHWGFDDDFANRNEWGSTALPVPAGTGQGEWNDAILSSSNQVRSLFAVNSCTMRINWPNGACLICAWITTSFARHRRNAWRPCIRTIRSICAKIDGHRCGIWRISITINAAWTKWIARVSKDDASARTKMPTAACAFPVVSLARREYCCGALQAHRFS